MKMLYSFPLGVQLSPRCRDVCFAGEGRNVSWSAVTAGTVIHVNGNAQAGGRHACASAAAWFCMHACPNVRDAKKLLRRTVREALRSCGRENTAVPCTSPTVCEFILVFPPFFVCFKRPLLCMIVGTCSGWRSLSSL